MSVVWYWAEGGRREGPMPWAALRDAARAGAFTPEAWIWTQGYGAEWRKASTLAENLFPKPEGAGAPGAPAAGADEAGAGASSPGASAAPDVPDASVAERSPFLPRLGENPAGLPVWHRPIARFAALRRFVRTRSAFDFGKDDFAVFHGCWKNPIKVDFAVLVLRVESFDAALEAIGIDCRVVGADVPVVRERFFDITFLFPKVHYAVLASQIALDKTDFHD